MTQQHTSEREVILRTLTQQVDALAQSLPSPVEVVLHDLAALPNSIIAICGDVTGRQPGDPATDMLLAAVASGRLETKIGYRTTAPSGRELLSTTIVVRDSTGQPIAALCINKDITDWLALGRLADSLHALAQHGSERPTTHPAPSASAASTPADGVPGEPAGQHSPASQESFVRDVDELAQVVLQQAISAQGIPVDLMRKEHKIQAVRHLRSHGFFLLRDAVETAATALGVTRFTVYNYLNEIEAGENSTDGTGAPHEVDADE